jgi:hypothetical protein
VHQHLRGVLVRRGNGDDQAGRLTRGKPPLVGDVPKVARFSALRLVIITNPSSNSIRALLSGPRAVTLQAWPLRPRRFQR